MTEWGEGSTETFLNLLREMMNRPDYLLPLASAQVQFRRDNYQMASASMLEDVFFDTFGTYLRESRPIVRLKRRTGKETWDYKLDQTPISHKEAISPSISIWWTSGEKVDGRWLPRPEFRTYSSDVPIVLVLSGTANFTGSVDTELGGHNVKVSASIGTRTIAGKNALAQSHRAVLVEHVAAGARVLNIWSQEQWKQSTFHSLWPLLGGPGIGTRDIWAIDSKSEVVSGDYLTVPQDTLLPGMYVLNKESLQNLPMIANNRAHSIDPQVLRGILAETRQQGAFVAFPLWFCAFSQSQPPNLYAQQRKEYERLFAARRID